jgi:hypothetical protein
MLKPLSACRTFIRCYMVLATFCLQDVHKMLHGPSLPQPLPERTPALLMMVSLPISNNAPSPKVDKRLQHSEEADMSIYSRTLIVMVNYLLNEVFKNFAKT